MGAICLKARRHFYFAETRHFYFAATVRRSRRGTRLLTESQPVLYSESAWKFISLPTPRRSSNGSPPAKAKRPLRWEETVARMLERQEQFIEGVNRGIAAADRGDLTDHEDVRNRIERLFRSCRGFAGRQKLQTGSKPS
jgi:hypothetical protein